MANLLCARDDSNPPFGLPKLNCRTVVEGHNSTTCGHRIMSINSIETSKKLKPRVASDPATARKMFAGVASLANQTADSNDPHFHATALSVISFQDQTATKLLYVAQTGAAWTPRREPRQRPSGLARRVIAELHLLLHAIAAIAWVGEGRSDAALDAFLRDKDSR